ncbi:hypothetical protein, partial [Paenibacillus sp. GCM10023250]|uniref:hypothetical protein n=1 Tax=Paenibacillus sp. GCM10023250 TaxID=3252648 RepID=UPI00361AF647
AGGLRQLLAALADAPPLPAEALDAYAAAAPGPDHAGFAAGVDALVRGLEQQLAQWREVQALADAKADAAD